LADNVTVSALDGTYLVEGIQLKRRKLVPRWLGDFILWTFFHRLDTVRYVTIKGFR